MSNIDKREIHNQQLKAFITGFLSDPAHDNQSSRSLTAEVFRIALASLEAEAVIIVGDDGGDALAYRRLIQTFAPGTKLYTAPPAPVSVMDEAQSRELFEKNCMANIERNKWHPDLYAHLPARE
ncbi:hypothetical protein [Enterobacter quasiroggenkampii]|uniref:hypothetical protein n=1 Tax=Enterobacter quasiroggenkampii TaxID=2497436 RepID=UPI0020061595|nr:hypothetical protein [Enterobacter quasiroggenkampii]MCK7307284.1 hypothetical protein [Enterobacter quasiroggenkampii]